MTSCITGLSKSAGARVPPCACSRHGFKSIGRGNPDVFERAVLHPQRFEVQTQVKMSVELCIRPRPRGREDLLRRERPPEHLIDLGHWDARVGTDRQQRRLGLRRRFGARDAEKMPRRILHIVWIHRSMRLELAAAVVVAAGVIQRDATLPEVGRLIGIGLRQAVERSGGFREAPVFRNRPLRDSGSLADSGPTTAEPGASSLSQIETDQCVVIADVHHSVGDRWVGPHRCRKDLRARDRLETIR